MGLVCWLSDCMPTCSLCHPTLCLKQTQFTTFIVGMVSSVQAVAFGANTGIAVEHSSAFPMVEPANVLWTGIACRLVQSCMLFRPSAPQLTSLCSATAASDWEWGIADEGAVQDIVSIVSSKQVSTC